MTNVLALALGALLGLLVAVVGDVLVRRRRQRRADQERQLVDQTARARALKALAAADYRTFTRKW